MGEDKRSRVRVLIAEGKSVELLPGEAIPEGPTQRTAPLTPRKRKPVPALPNKNITNLYGRKFGLLMVKHFAGAFKGRAYWCVKCECLPGCKDCMGKGCARKMKGSSLIGGRAMSCGCSRTDHDVRHRAAMKVPVKVRKARAEAAAKKCTGTKLPPAYRLDMHRVTDLTGESLERVTQLCKDGVLRTAYRGGRVRVSAADVAEYIASKSRAVRVCPLAEQPNVDETR